MTLDCNDLKRLRRVFFMVLTGFWLLFIAGAAAALGYTKVGLALLIVSSFTSMGAGIAGFGLAVYFHTRFELRK